MKEILRQENLCTKSTNLVTIESSTSKGAQPKWFDYENNIYYKKDYHGYESLAEWVVYNVLDTCTNLDKSLILPYHLCFIDDEAGCYSYDFKQGLEDAEEITLRTMNRLNGITDDKFMKMTLRKPIKESFSILCDIIESVTSKRFEDELKILFAVDAFFLNEDRHTVNLSFIRYGNGNYKLSPIFDNGMCLLSRVEAYSMITSTRLLIDKPRARLLSPRFDKHLELYDGAPFIYKKKLHEFVDKIWNIDVPEVRRIATILELQLSNKYTQKLFIPEEPGLTKSSIFS